MPRGTILKIINLGIVWLLEWNKLKYLIKLVNSTILIQNDSHDYSYYISTKQTTLLRH